MSIEEKQRKVLKDFQKGSRFRLNGRIIQFARANEEDLKNIQELTTGDLILRHYSLTNVMEISFSLGDCELEILMMLEMEKRKVTEEQYKEVIRNSRRKMETKKSE